MEKPATPDTPEQSPELLSRIKLVRRDLGNLLVHFTRSAKGKREWEPKTAPDRQLSALEILNIILNDGKLKGTSKWSYGQNCVCFSEAPIHEFNSIFALNEIAASERERPRYEPYGIAVSKSWLFDQGGRPVIYDTPEALDSFPDDQKYRFVHYDPRSRIDYTWEREWRIKTEHLVLAPRETLVIVPTAAQAFEIVYGFAEERIEPDDETSATLWHEPKWLAVSLDIFGFKDLALRANLSATASATGSLS